MAGLEPPSLEVKLRLEKILAEPNPTKSAAALQAERAVQVLEWIGSAASTKLLAEIASQGNGTTICGQAESAVSRLKTAAGDH